MDARQRFNQRHTYRSDSTQEDFLVGQAFEPDLREHSALFVRIAVQGTYQTAGFRGHTRPPSDSTAALAVCPEGRDRPLFRTDVVNKMPSEQESCL